MLDAKPVRTAATKESRANSGAVPGAFERGFMAGTEAQRAVTADAIRHVLWAAADASASEPYLAQSLERLRSLLP